jgi:hypothetical protein
MSGKLSITRNLFGAGKGDKMRPCEISRQRERANWCLAFGQCFDCGRRGVPKGERRDLSLMTGDPPNTTLITTMICEDCRNNGDPNNS